MSLPSSPNNPTEIKRCEELWFKDGSIIIRCKTVMFRVYQGILSAQSPVFLDMFAMPQPDNAEKMDDVPVVDLIDDPRDLTYFLRSLNDTCFYDDSVQELHIVAAILRLSTKYQVTPLRHRAIAQLLTAFPTTFHEFVQVVQNPSSSKIRYFEGIEVVVVNIGEQHDVPQILPSAYYKLMNEPHQALDGVVNQDSPVSIAEDLCSRAVARCMAGREAVRRAMIQDIHSFITQRFCPYSNQPCNFGRMNIWRSIEDGLTTKTLGPFHGPGEGNGAVDVSALCTTCQTYRNNFEVKQLEAWESLPEWFGLPSWDKLLSYAD